VWRSDARRIVARGGVGEGSVRRRCPGPLDAARGPRVAGRWGARARGIHAGELASAAIGRSFVAVPTSGPADKRAARCLDLLGDVRGGDGHDGSPARRGRRARACRCRRDRRPVVVAFRRWACFPASIAVSDRTASAAGEDGSREHRGDASALSLRSPRRAAMTKASWQEKQVALPTRQRSRAWCNLRASVLARRRGPSPTTGLRLVGRECTRPSSCTMAAQVDRRRAVGGSRPARAGAPPRDGDREASASSIPRSRFDAGSIPRRGSARSWVLRLRGCGASRQEPAWTAPRTSSLSGPQRQSHQRFSRRCETTRRVLFDLAVARVARCRVAARGEAQDANTLARKSP